MQPAYCIIFLLSSLVATYNVNFNQNRYDMILERAELNEWNPDVVDYVKLISFKTRNNGILLNFTTSFKNDVVNEVKMHAQAFQFYSNEYRKTTIDLVVSQCQLIKSGYFGADLWRTTNGNFTTCPWKKGVYAVWNYQLISSKFPPLIPEGRYKLLLATFEHKTNIKMYTFTIYVNIIYKV